MRLRNIGSLLGAAALTLALPSVARAAEYTWIGPTSSTCFTCDGTWESACCWLPMGVPGPSDSASVAGMNGNGTVTIAGSETVSSFALGPGGTLYSDAGASLTVTQDSSGGASTVTISGGTVGGVLVIDTLTTGTITGSFAVNSGTLRNKGALTWMSGTITGAGEGVIDNAGVFHMISNGGFDDPSGLDTSTLINGGTLDYEGGATEAIGHFWALRNTGVINVESGVLQLFDPGNQDHFLGDGSHIEGAGKLLFADPTRSAVELEGAITIDAGATIEMSGANVWYGDSATVGGEGTFVWSGGALGGAKDGSSVITFASPLAFNITGDDPKVLESATIVNDTTLTFGGAGSLGASNTGVIRNLSVFRAVGNGALDYSVQGGSNDALFENFGTFLRQADAGTTFLHSPWVFEQESTGVVNVLTGVVQIDFGATLHDGGIFDGPGKTTLGSPDGMGSGTSVTPDGTIHLGMGATLEIAAQSAWAGSVTFAGLGTLLWTGGALNDGVGPMTTYTFAQDLLLHVTGSSLKESSASVVFAGNTTWDGTGSYQVDDGTVINQGTMTAASDATLDRNTSGALFQNTGYFFKDGGTGVTKIVVAFANSGTFEVKTGTADLYGGTFTQTGGVTRLDGTTLSSKVDDGSTAGLEFAGGTLEGTGTIEGDLRMNARMVLGGAGKVGKLHVTGDYKQTSTGELDIDLGGKNPGVDFDLLAIDGKETIDGSLGVGLVGGFLPAKGDTYDVVTFLSGEGSGTFSTIAPPSHVKMTATYEPADVALGITEVIASAGAGGAAGNGGGGGNSAGAGGAAASAGAGGATAGQGGAGTAGGATAGQGGSSGVGGGSSGHAGSSGESGGTSSAAGSDASGSGGTSGNADASTAPSDDSGGGCAASGHRAPGSSALLLVALVGLAGARKKQRLTSSRDRSRSGTSRRSSTCGRTPR